MDSVTIGTIVSMEKMSGVSISTTDYFEVAFTSAVGAVGMGPVPATDLVLITTLWMIVPPSEPLPAIFAFIAAIDRLLDRLVTVVNVTSDTVVCRVVAELVDGTAVKTQGVEDSTNGDSSYDEDRVADLINA
ncbi:hypothetical protein BBJ28_00023397 [Nothophytophthora sp. Chile5]|nr:hypothetical protein BBJ28_00023397 [Nothophytophthora sp. Chile5]